MNVAFLMQDTGSVYGAERVTLDLMRGLRDRADGRVSAMLITETRLALTGSRLREELGRISIPCAALSTSVPFSPRLAGRIAQSAAGDGIHVLHAIGYKADVHAVLARRRARNLALVATVHGWLYRPDPKELFYGWLDVRALKRMDAVVALSRYYEQRLNRSGIREVWRIPSGLDVGPSPARAPGQGATLGIMGRLSSEKNHGMLFRAIRRLKERGTVVRCCVAGEGPGRHKLEADARTLGIAGQVEFAGYIPRDEFLARVDGVVLCSRIENLPRTILEAMAAAKPVFATRVGGIPDLVDEGVTGHLVPPDDDVALADRIQSALSEPSRWADLGRAGRAKVEREFTMAQMIDRHIDLYREVQQRRGQGHG